MEITGVEQYHLNYELEGSFSPTWIPGYSQGSHEVELFTIKTDENITGITASPSFGGGLNYQDWAELVLVGENPYHVEKIIRKLKSVNLFGPRVWHLEVGLWDIIGKDLGKPVYELLGGSGEKIKAYASSGELQGVDSRIDYVSDRVDEGFEAVKLRFQSEDPEEDLEVVRRMREEFPEIMIMIDANMGWKIRVLENGVRWTFNDALKVARELEKIDNIVWFEEPLDMKDFQGLANLRQKTDIPIAGGELNEGITDFREFIQKGSLDILQPDAILSTGIMNAKKVASMAETNGLEFNPHTWTNGIGLATNLHVMACTHSRWCEFPLEPPAWVPEARDFMLSEPIQTKNGYITPPSNPGLGIEIDWDLVKNN